MELYSIDSQIQYKANQLAWNSAKIAENKIKIERLETALSGLDSKKTLFSQQSSLCLEPTHSPKTLHGEHEEAILAIQENRLKVEFLAISTIQIAEAEERIEQKRSELASEILSLESANASLHSSQRSLSAQRAEVIRKNAERN